MITLCSPHPNTSVAHGQNMKHTSWLASLLGERESTRFRLLGTTRSANPRPHGARRDLRTMASHSCDSRFSSASAVSSSFLLLQLRASFSGLDPANACAPKVPNLVAHKASTLLLTFPRLFPAAMASTISAPTQSPNLECGDRPKLHVDEHVRYIQTLDDVRIVCSVRFGPG